MPAEGSYDVTYGLQLTLRLLGTTVALAIALLLCPSVWSEPAPPW